MYRVQLRLYTVVYIVQCTFYTVHGRLRYFCATVICEYYKVPDSYKVMPQVSRLGPLWKVTTPWPLVYTLLIHFRGLFFWYFRTKTRLFVQLQFERSNRQNADKFCANFCVTVKLHFTVASCYISGKKKHFYGGI